MTQFLGQRLLFFTGKGGVGKTLLSAGHALNCSDQGERTLWIEMSDQPKGQYLFPGYHPEYIPTRLAKNLWGMNLRFAPAIAEYLHIIFRIKWLSSRIAQNNLFQVFTVALPGLYALVTLGKIWYEAGLMRTVVDANGKKRKAQQWDRIIVDAPATGHGLSWFQLPTTAQQLVKNGPIADRTRDIETMLTNATHTGVIVVSVLEKMVVDETLYLISQLQELTPIKVQGVLVNKVFPAVVTDQANQDRYRNWLNSGEDSAFAQAMNDWQSAVRSQLNWYQGWVDEQQMLLPELMESSLSTFSVPWFPEVKDVQLLANLKPVLQWIATGDDR